MTESQIKQRVQSMLLEVSESASTVARIKQGQSGPSIPPQELAHYERMGATVERIMMLVRGGVER